MAAGVLDITLQQGTAYSLRMNITGINLQSYSVGNAQTRKPYSNVVLALAFTVTIVPSGTTGGTITLAATEPSVSLMAPGQYDWDLFISGPAGNPSPELLLVGALTVKPRVTR